MRASKSTCARLVALLVIAFAAPAVVATAAADVHQAVLVTPALSGDAGGGRVLWAHCRRRDCGLYTRVNGTTSRLPIAPFGIAEDPEQASLGVGPNGDEVAAYDRCGPRLRDCGLYIYDFSTGTEQRLPVSQHPGAFMTPTVSGDRVAYAYNRLGRDGPNRTFGIYWSYLDSTRMNRVHTEPLDAVRDQPVLALNGDLLAYQGDSWLGNCFDQTHVRIINLSTGADRLVATGNEGTDVISPHWDGSLLYYARDLFTVKDYRHDLKAGGIVHSRVERYSVASGITTASPYARLGITQVLPDGSALYYDLVTHQARTTGLYSIDPPSFHRIRAHRRLQRVHR